MSLWTTLTSTLIINKKTTFQQANKQNIHDVDKQRYFEHDSL